MLGPQPPHRPKAPPAVGEDPHHARAALYLLEVVDIRSWLTLRSKAVSKAPPGRLSPWVASLLPLTSVSDYLRGFQRDGARGRYLPLPPRCFQREGLSATRRWAVEGAFA